MRKNSIQLCVAAMPLVLGSVALAQSTTSSTTESAGDAGGYTLKGSSIKPAAAPQGNAAPYELSGTSFSGTSKATEVILTAPINADAAPIKTGTGIYLYPTAFLGFGTNSNLQMTSTNELSSSFVNFAPELVAELKNSGDRYTLLASANTTSYNNSSADNYTNSEFTLAGDNYFTSRARAGWSLGQTNGSDPRGSNNRPVSAEPDRWHSTNLDGRLIYGAPEAQGRVELDLGNKVKTYDNNRVNTAIADFTLNAVAARVYYRLGSRTQALAEVRSNKANYASALATDSNTERRYYGGITWEATAATTGIIKLGNMTKDFDAAGKTAFNGGSWEMAVRWLPVSYSAFDLQTSRATADASGVGDYTLNTSTDLTWNHKWSRSLSSRVSAGVLDIDYGGTARKDTTNNFALTVDYALLRWLKVGVDFATTDNTSNTANAAYKRTVSMLTLNASL